MLIRILIGIFGLYLLYCVVTTHSTSTSTSPLVEGLTTETPSTATDYKPYNVSDPNNSLILAQQNAGNIEVLKGRIDDLDKMKSQVDTMQESITMMQTQMDGLVQQQAEYAQELAGSTPPTVTGLDEEDDGP